MLKQLLKDAGISEQYGIDHCDAVYNHMVMALDSVFQKYSKSYFEPEKKLTLKLAALLHMVDNVKYFPKGSQNAKAII